MGGTGEQLARIAESDRRLRATARTGAGTAGIGLGLTTALAGLASWGALALGVGAIHGGSIERRPAGRAGARPAGRLRARLPVAGGHPGVAALARRPPAVSSPPWTRRPRSTSPNCRRCCPAASRIIALERGVGRLSRRGPAGPARRRPRPSPGSPGGPRRAERRRQVDAGRRPGPLPARRRRNRPRSTACRSSASPPTTCAAWSGWSSRARTSSTRRWPRTCASGAAPPTDEELSDVLTRVGLGDWLAGLPDGSRHRRRPGRARASRAGSASGSPWRAPCWPTFPSSSSTSRPSTSNPAPPTP